MAEFFINFSHLIDEKSPVNIRVIGETQKEDSVNNERKNSDIMALEYIISGEGAGAGAGGLGRSHTRLSVVKTIAAMLAAFCRAERDTLVGSIMPLSAIMQYSSLYAS